MLFTSETNQFEIGIFPSSSVGLDCYYFNSIYAFEHRKRVGEGVKVNHTFGNVNSKENRKLVVCVFLR